MCEFYIRDFIVAKHPQGIILGRVVGHEIYPNRIGYCIQLYNDKIIDETLFNGYDEENGEMPIRKATDKEREIFNKMHNEYVDLKMKIIDLIDKMEYEVKF
jgi:hypothetical protein